MTHISSIRVFAQGLLTGDPRAGDEQELLGAMFSSLSKQQEAEAWAPVSPKPAHMLSS